MGVKGGKALGLPGASAGECSHAAFVEAGASKMYETAKITFEHLRAFDWKLSVTRQPNIRPEKQVGVNLGRPCPQTPGQKLPRHRYTEGQFCKSPVLLNWQISREKVPSNIFISRSSKAQTYN